MDPTIISAGASILGGLFGRKGHDAGGNSSLAIRGQAHGARWAADQFGFNPLTLLGVSSALPGTQNNAVLGQGIANAGLAIADGMNQKKLLEIERQKVAQDQKRLDALIEKNTLRPKVGGVYAVQAGTPSGGGVGSSVPTLSAPPRLTFGDMVKMRDAYQPTPEDIKGPADASSGISKVPGKFFGINLKRSGLFSDGAFFEEGYGDVLGAIVGLPSIASDIGYTMAEMAHKKYKKQRFDAATRKSAERPLRPDDAFNTRPKFSWEK